MPKFNEGNVLEALRNVIEPDLGKDLVTLGMVKDILISDNGDVKFTVILTTPACPLKDMIRTACINAIKHFIPESSNVTVEMTASTTSSIQSSSDKKTGFSQIKNTIAVASGKGGVGKSTITANLAVALAKHGAKVGLIDADIYGPSIPTMFGLKTQKPEIKGKTLIPIEKYGVKLISIGFLSDPKSAVVWRGPMLSGVLKQFIEDVLWGELDYMLFDLPPGTGDVQLTLAQSLKLTGSVIVTTPQDVALSDVIKAISMFEKLRVPILGIIENMSYYLLPNNTKDYIFGQSGGEKLAKEKNLNLLGEIPIVKTIRESGDNGSPIASESNNDSSFFADIAQKLAQQVSIRNANVNSNVEIEL